MASTTLHRTASSVGIDYVVRLFARHARDAAAAWARPEAMHGVPLSIVEVGSKCGLFAQHAADAEVSGAMLEAGCRTSIIPIV